MSAVDDWDNVERPSDDLALGRPRPDDPALMTARQLVAACADARRPEDLDYAAAETEAFLETAGETAPDGALLALLGLPCSEVTMQALADLNHLLAVRAPGMVPALYRIAIGGRGPAGVNAATVLASLTRPDLAAGLALVLADEQASRRVKEAAADALLEIVPRAPGVILDALAEPEVRAWLVRASGCSPNVTDADLMRRLTARGEES